METLRASGRTGALGAAGLCNAVVVIEVALAFVLLIGSGLMFRTFLNIQRVDLGFNQDGLLTFQLLGNVGQTPQERDMFKRQLREKLGALPGVKTVTASFPMPLAGEFSPVRWAGWVSWKNGNIVDLTKEHKLSKKSKSLRSSK